MEHFLNVPVIANDYENAEFDYSSTGNFTIDISHLESPLVNPSFTLSGTAEGVDVMIFRINDAGSVSTVS